MLLSDGDPMLKNTSFLKYNLHVLHYILSKLFISILGHMSQNNIKVQMRDYPVFKLLLCGPGESGKSTLCKRITTGKFDPDYKPTVGAEFYSYPLKVRGKSVALIYDFAGQSRFSVVRQLLYRGSDAAGIVFDLSKRESFREVAAWIREIRKYCKDIEITIIGNKADLKNRQVSRDEAEAICRKLGCKYVETSAKAGSGLSIMFKHLVKSALKHYDVRDSA